MPRISSSHPETMEMTKMILDGQIPLEDDRKFNSLIENQVIIGKENKLTVHTIIIHGE